MPMLAFFPWLHLNAPITIGRFNLFSLDASDVPHTCIATSVSAETIGKVLTQYHESANRPLKRVTVLQYDERPLGCDFNETERTAIFRFGQHLAVSGLSNRRFIGGFPDNYTASGHYQVVIQAFTEPHSGCVSLTHRRKGGHAKILFGQGSVQFVRPAHLVSQGEPNFNLRLLTALQAASSLPETVHEHIEASITQFLLANSDSPDVPLEAESIATYAALERATNSNQTLKDIQQKLPVILAIVDSSPWTALMRKELGLSLNADKAVLQSWLKNIYALRGNVAHGKSAQRSPQQWSQQEHLVAGSFIYPLTLKCLLAKNSLYRLDEVDVAWVLGLEKLLGDTPFFKTSPDLLQASEIDGVSFPENDVPSSQTTRWQLQFDSINSALFSLRLSQDIRAHMQNS